MTIFAIQTRNGVQRDEDGFVVDAGTVTGEVGRIDAPYPMAAHGPAEAALRAAGITWSGYCNGCDWTCGWYTSIGVVTLAPVLA